MHYISSDYASEDCLPEDDIDQLFKRLPQIEVPDELVNILLHVGHSPVPANISCPIQNVWQDYPAGTGFDVHIVRNEKREPS